MSGSFIDTHAHLNMEVYDADRDAVVEKSLAAGVAGIIDVAVDLATCFRSIELASQYPIVFSAVGIHPHEVSKASREHLQRLKIFCQNPKVLAIGEIGLDYHYNFSPPETQKQFFLAQLELARELEKPIIVHVREAMTDALALIRSLAPSGWKGVFHCFGGKAKDIPEILEMGFMISFTGVVTFHNFKKQDLVRAVPLDRILLETDAPYMTPVPFRGKRNEPCFLPYIAKVIASFYSVSEQVLASATTTNAKKLFGFG